MKRSLRSLSLAAALPLTLSIALAQDPTVPPGGRGPRPGGGQAGGPTAPKPGPKPYAEVITKDAVTQEGLFKVHQLDEKVYFEIPAAALGKDLLWTATTSAGNAEDAFAGLAAGQTIVRFVRRGTRVYLKAVDYNLRDAAQTDPGFKTNVELNSSETIVGSYPVAADAPDGSAVIDVSALFLGNPTDIGSRRASTAAVDPNRSFIEKVKAFPKNIEVTSTETITGGGAANPFGGRPAAGAGATTTQVHYSMVALPEKPMMGRLSDSRIGFFSTDFTTIGEKENRIKEKGYITRFRLEKQDPNARLSEPVQPITWYIAKEVPAKWRPWLKKGIEEWNTAFEQAGFKNAIVVKDAPNDPDWNPEDARYSVVRWSPRAVENAYAGPITDPRSGETISAQMVIFQDVMKLSQGWYYAQCGAVDPRARQLPVSDQLQGELLQYVVAHECGHALGLYHNWKASSHYTVAQLRDPKFTSENGVSASIMDYSRFNYVAQPGDGVTRLIGFVGPYDKFAIQWGYSALPGMKSPDDETKVLDGWLGRQVSDARLQYWPEGDPIDSAAQNEDIGNDAVAVGRMGLKNLDRIAKNILMPSTTSKVGKDYSLLSEMQGRLISQRLQESIHVLKNVGGVVGTDYHVGRGGEVYATVPKAKQAECVSFLVNEALKPSAALYAPAVLNRIQPSGMVRDINGVQSLVIGSLLAESRLQRLTDQEGMLGAKAYTVSNLVSDVTNGTWSELGSTKPSVDLIRRGLQRTYLRVMDTKINASAPSNTDIKMNSIAALQALAKKIDKAIPKAADEATRRHLVASRRDITNIMNGKYSPVTVEVAQAPQGPGRRAIEGLMGCGMEKEELIYDHD